jgi:hypothetical protein
MPECKRSISDEALHVLGECEQAKRVGDGGPILPDCLRHLLMRETEIADQLPVTFGFFNWIEVFSLEVLD